VKFLVLIQMVFVVAVTSANENSFHQWRQEGKTCQFEVESMPSINWDGKSALPISINEVDQFFRDAVAKELESNQSVEVTNYVLSRTFTERLMQTIWLYRIEYLVFEPKNVNFPVRRQLAITLDGSVLYPRCDV